MSCPRPGKAGHGLDAYASWPAPQRQRKPIDLPVIAELSIFHAVQQDADISLITSRSHQVFITAEQFHISTMDAGTYAVCTPQ